MGGGTGIGEAPAPVTIPRENGLSRRGFAPTMTLPATARNGCREYRVHRRTVSAPDGRQRLPNTSSQIISNQNGTLRPSRRVASPGPSPYDRFDTVHARTVWGSVSSLRLQALRGPVEEGTFGSVTSGVLLTRPGATPGDGGRRQPVSLKRLSNGDTWSMKGVWLGVELCHPRRQQGRGPRRSRHAGKEMGP